jgi:nucleotide-binding universal stress UspA family protein
VFRRHRPFAARGYRRVLVLLDSRRESLDAFEIACRLAADDRAALTALVVVDVPTSLPLDAHMSREEDEARDLLERASATGDSYGVKVRPRIVRARGVGAEVLRSARADRAELIVLGAPRRELGAPRRRHPQPTLVDVLTRAPCRVMVVSDRGRQAA